MIIYPHFILHLKIKQIIWYTKTDAELIKGQCKVLPYSVLSLIGIVQ